MANVSVCIPTYNTAKYLPFAIESVLSQDYQDYELVICDDASTDNTSDVCAGYKDSRIRYIRTAGKSGQGGIFNRCLQEAQNQYVTILHADDYFLPGFLSDRVSRLESDPNLDFVFGTVKQIDASGNHIGDSGRWSEDRLFARGELLEFMLHGCILCPPSLMIRKACLEKVGLFRNDLTWGPDWEWDLRLAEHCSGYFTTQAVAASRVHDESGTAEQLSAAKNGPQERQILLETFSRLCEKDNSYKKLKRPVFQALSRRHMYFAEQALLGHRKSVTRSNLRYAALADPFMLVRPNYWALLMGSLCGIKFYTSFRRIRGLATKHPCV